MKKLSKIRLIAGEWRSRQVTFMPNEGIRPTPDRIRETLFNWLTPYIEGANCLDLFAGSGALSFEALSRGAAHSVLIEQNPLVLRHLQENQERLQTRDITLLLGKLPKDFERMGKLIPSQLVPFDVIFLDPPFEKDLLAPCCEWLEENKWVKSGSFIYIEAEKKLEPLPIPSTWELIKEKTTQQVRYGLAKKL